MVESVENGTILGRRDNGEKIECNLDELEAVVANLLDNIQKDMLEKARAHRDAHTYVAKSMDEMKQILDTTPGFVKAMWCWRFHQLVCGTRKLIFQQ